MTSTELMTVGELSRRTGVPIKTLRQYTDWGMVYTVGRSATNYRLFDTDALWCVHLIGQLRGLGLTVAEIRELAGAGAPVAPRLAELLRVSRARLDQRIAELRRTLRRIDEFEAAHHAELTGRDDACWAGDPRCAANG
ncbi:DNA-binding transcriptional regulator, MerR family [Amycolatopsis arida]|uniref:DNA-binding transcriptional regulator, MerR family n=1 Tax=Amycolatopsis arida TaxID=587909 RepID=A0A1I6AS08_9PSEU|nr:MerR family transcriptional regulator [Amycolatopsis arida]TDX97563.1 DNA-binding transcriptional MerR regulator [Amycolatopsis arida]SFQ71513.1 DNA-binding transcriptional regulator, MerR family [Amycolatopsis arida]